MTTIEEHIDSDETAAGGQQPAGQEQRPAGRGLSPRLGRAMAGVLAGLVVLALVVLALELLVLRPRYEAAQADQKARNDVVRVAQRFTAEVNDYDASTIDGYRKRISPMLSTKFRGQFAQAMSQVMSSVKQAHMSSQGNVLASAVASLDPDSAQVLVVSDAKVKTVFGTKVRHFRWEVSLVNVDGRWLVDDFSPVT